jgi:3'-phosphoadenosine 5'-phosphosulfate sulfotransferase (PAPS reductase)/FAD synthetase
VRDPFLIDSPTCISFSGGRTSAYMLWRVLQSNGGLPPEALVCFANTGKEEEQTLEFVRDCGERWGVDIQWLEYNPAVKDSVDEVSFDSASRNGEPFEAIIRKRQYLPNPIARFCTVELKIRTMHRLLKSLGWTDWQQMIGIRADEQRRVVKIRARPSPETVHETMILPLADAGVTLREVNEFWERQPFTLRLATDSKGRTTSGNCDLCFLKGGHQIMSLIRERPQRAEWWKSMESLAQSLGAKPSGALFRMDRPCYAAMLANVQAQQALFDDDDEGGIPCFCGE